jgi:hypothetical protein
MPQDDHPRYEDEFDTHTAVEWNEGRRKANKIIRRYNKWLRRGRGPDKKPKLLARIQQGLDTFASEDCDGPAWREALLRIKQQVEDS